MKILNLILGAAEKLFSEEFLFEKGSSDLKSEVNLTLINDSNNDQKQINIMDNEENSCSEKEQILIEDESLTCSNLLPCSMDSINAMIKSKSSNHGK
jgi:hypothetical protein